MSRCLLYPLDLIITREQVRRLRSSNLNSSNSSNNNSQTDSKDENKRGTPADDSASSSPPSIWSPESWPMLADARHTITTHGLGGLYAGLGTEVAKTALDAFIFFFFYTSISTSRRISLTEARDRTILPAELQGLVASSKAVASAGSGIYQRRRGGATRPPPAMVSLPVVDDLLIGMLASAVAKFFTTPLATVVSHQQADDSSQRGDNNVNRKNQLSTLDRLRSTGLARLWAGYPFALVLTLNPALTFLLQRLLLRLLVKKRRRSNPPAGVMFIIAALSKAFACLVTYPIGLARTRAVLAGLASSSSSESSESKLKSEPQVNDSPRSRLRHLIQQMLVPLETVAAIHSSEGVAGLYAGVGAEVLKSFLGHGFTVLTKSRIHDLVVRLYWIAVGSSSSDHSVGNSPRMASGEPVSTTGLASSSSSPSSVRDKTGWKSDIPLLDRLDRLTEPKPEDEVGDIVDELSKNIATEDG